MFSITSVPSSVFIRSAHGRPMVSYAPPGGNGTISRTGRSGYFACAHARAGQRGAESRRGTEFQKITSPHRIPHPDGHFARQLRAIGDARYKGRIGRPLRHRAAGLGCRPTSVRRTNGCAKGRGGDGRGNRHRQGGVAGARQGRLCRGAGRPPRRQARRDRKGGRQRQDPLGADRRQRSGIDQGAVRAREEGIRPARPAVQQRRHRRARGADGGTAARNLEEGGRHQPHRHVRVHPGSHQDHEGAGPEGRPHHQQRLDLGAHAAAARRRLHRDQARGHRPHQADRARLPRTT